MRILQIVPDQPAARRELARLGRAAGTSPRSAGGLFLRGRYGGRLCF